LRAPERRFFSRIPQGYGPDGPELGVFGFRQASIHAEEIFETFAGERVALHVEEKIASLNQCYALRRGGVRRGFLRGKVTCCSAGANPKQ
jgi:hypothetical protein